MALAHLKYRNTAGTSRQFDIDIGQNRFFTFLIGEDEVTRKNGFKIIKDAEAVPRLWGPMPPQNRGMETISIPMDAFSHNKRYLQLLSFKDNQRNGPALSSVIKVPIISKGQLDDLGLLPQVFSLNEKAMTTTKNISFQCKEVNYSETKFLNAIMPFIEKAIPFLGGLFGGGGNSEGGAGNNGGGLKEMLGSIFGNQEVQDSLLKVLADLSAQNGGSQVQSQSFSFAKKNYSEAKVAPALLAALPALAGLFEKALDPENVKNILDHPIKMMEAGAGLGQGYSQLDPGMMALLQDNVNPQQLLTNNQFMQNQLLQSIIQGNAAARAQAQSLKKSGIKFKSVKSVKLELADLGESGKKKTAYYTIQDNIIFPLRLTMPKSMTRNVRLLALLKDLDSGETVWKRKYPLDIASNGIIDDVSVNTGAFDRKTGSYCLKVLLLWDNKKGQKYGSQMYQHIEFIDQYLYENNTPTSETILLNDVVAHRDFWHKAWGATFLDASSKKYWDCKYYSYYEAGKNSNARMETITQEQGNNDGRLKTGMALSASKINQLIPAISGYSALSYTQLNAIDKPGVWEKLQKVSRSKVEFRGMKGDSVGLYIFPELAFYQFELKRVKKVFPNGFVSSFENEIVYFPVPHMCHFIGTRQE